MRIAYIAPYQGPSLLKARPIVRNLSLAGSVKIEFIARVLSIQKHQVDIISQGEIVELNCKWYPSFRESEPFHPDIPIYYASALPIRFLNGLWSSRRTLELFKIRHQQSPYDLVIIYNLKLPQIVCADYAIRRLGLPVVFEYEDDAFVDITGKDEAKARFPFGTDSSKLLNMVAGCMAASPHLLSQLPATIPKLLFRGAVGHDLMQSSEQMRTVKKNWVLFSGTHYRSKGIKQLIAAWRELSMPDWELHITGYGELTNTLQDMVGNDPTIVFHGLVSRQELMRLMCSTKVCINPHDISQTPGNIFAFKIIEYLAAGAHVISTPMGALEEEIESGMTYMPDNHPATIVAALKDVILGATWRRTARQYVLDTYGPQSISKNLDMLLQQASAYHCSETGPRKF
ncbi:MAG: glycosyltransferase [Nitrospirota bacterium]|nr:glycosyltransferase [Nitrospirota bacterium]